MLKIWKTSGKFIWRILVGLAVFAMVSAGLAGCGGDTKDDGKLQDLEFTVVGEREAPPALSELITKKKESSFKLTYADGQDLYIVIGAGPQAGGGYSVTVKELYLTDNAIVIRTELLGPAKEEPVGNGTSCPVLVVKTAFRDEPVVFY